MQKSFRKTIIMQQISNKKSCISFFMVPPLSDGNFFNPLLNFYNDFFH